MLERSGDLSGESRVSIGLEFLEEKEADVEAVGEQRKGRLVQLQQLLQLRNEANQVKWVASF